MDKAIIINPRDNVGVALFELNKGENFGNVEITSNIPEKHKFALTDIAKGENVIKYGYPIGIATTHIKKGDHIHTHNLKTALTDSADYIFKGENSYLQKETDLTFMGYLRKNGKVGIRNRIFIIPTVGCANNAAKMIAEKANKELNLGSDVLALTHPYGCSQLGDDASNTAKCIAALCKHPNAGGALLLSLGCENNNLKVMKPYLGEYDTDRIRLLNMQECDDEIEEGLEELKQKLDYLKTVKSTEIEQKLKEARGHGDLSENSEYDEAKNEQGKLAAEIAELEASIANAVIVESTNTSSSEVGIGSKIRLLDIELGEEEIIKIVGYAEANFEEGKISDESPIGMAVMGKKAGDVVEVQTPEGVVEMKIVEIIKK